MSNLIPSSKLYLFFHFICFLESPQICPFRFSKQYQQLQANVIFKSLLHQNNIYYWDSVFDNNKLVVNI